MRVTDLTGSLNLSRRGTQRRESVILPSFILMTDDVRLADPVAVVETLPKNSAVIFRHYESPDRESLAAGLIARARPRGVRVLVAADAGLAVKLGADGLHLPETMAKRGPGCWQAWRQPGWLVTASAHSEAALHRAQGAGADAALLAPVFRTASHPQTPPLGPIRFAAWCRRSPLPVYALGGISKASARRLKNSGVRGFAGISGFLI